MEEDDRQCGESGTEGADAHDNDVADADELPTREREEYAKASRIEPQLPIYRPADVGDRSSSDLYAPQSTDVVRRQLIEAIRIAGPICEEDLFQRVARAWGLSRTGHKIVERLRGALPWKQTITDEDGTRFLWPEGVLPQSWTDFRVADSRQDSERHVTNVCRQELANIALHVLESHGSMGDDDLARTVARMIGMARVPEAAAKRLRMVFRWMEKSAKADRVDGRLRCSE